MESSPDTQRFCSIIIVTYNSKRCILSCLAPVAGMPEVEIVVVDNNSRDGTALVVKEQYPGIALIALEENYGFGRACNIGVAASGGSTVVLLNPDAIASAQSIRLLVEFLAKHPRAGIVGGRLIDFSGLPLQSMGDHPSVVRLVLEKPLGLVAKRVKAQGIFRRAIERYCAKLRVAHAAERVAWVSGAALCCRRQTWDDIGGFDENFFLYYEDVDLCLRAAQKFWEVWHNPAAIVVHQSGASFAGNADYQKRVYYANQHYYFHKHQGPVIAGFVRWAQKVYGWWL